MINKSKIMLVEALFISGKAVQLNYKILSLCFSWRASINGKSPLKDLKNCLKIFIMFAFAAILFMHLKKD